MKHAGLLVLLAAAAGLMGALSAGSADAATRIYVTLSRSEKFIDGIRDAILREDQADNEVEVTLELANGDSATQQKQIDDAVAKKYDAIMVLTVDDASGQHALDRVRKAGIPLVFVNTPPPGAEFTGKVSIVACNDIVAGRLQMRMLSRAIHDQGNVAVIRGEDGHAATDDRTQGIKEILATHPGLKLVESESAHWSRDTAEQLVSGWLDHGVHLDAIAANSDEMALGAAEALRKHGITTGKIFVGGNDGTSHGLDGIKSGDLAVTMRQDTAAMAHMALLNARTMAQGGYAQLYEWVPYEIVLPSNIGQYAAQ
ncbi:substrate-binding domain-containing protein [Asticcacaulis solisilvae]|uniref:substrate-binding domain-containing protein n=1 Tax=Asticcacaulis solisilvae TaxID=1217274 RepID=UPI003FD7CC51